MLHELHIEHLGVIESLDLVLGPGLTALTGETGAGKTMLVEAIGLLLGDRADPSMVRSGADEARVEGRFVVGEDEMVLARVIPVEGRSRAYVNGRLATVSTLAEHGRVLVDLHGQHAHQGLLTAAAQRAALDRFAAVDPEPLRRSRARLTEIDAALAALGGDARTRAREVDLLGFQLDELANADLVDPDEETALEQREDLLADAAAHRERAAMAITAIQEDGGALDQVAVARQALTGRHLFDEAVERLKAVAAELADLAGELRSTAEGIEDDQDALSSVRERRQLLRNLRRKYGETLAEVIDYRDEVAQRLTELRGYEQSVARLESDRTAALAAERSAAAVVGATRRAASDDLAVEVQARLRTLAMPRAEVRIEVGSDDPGDDVTIMLAANPGSPALPLSKVASGGELARVMLALRLVLTEGPSTLVFDEVDAGIGGSAATAVAEALARLGETHQVLVVTHLAQVAAAADTQVVVSKTSQHRTTTATASTVRGEERVAEVARMLSGEPDSSVAREHAASLLSQRPTVPRRRGSARPT